MRKTGRFMGWLGTGCMLLLIAGKLGGAETLPVAVAGTSRYAATSPVRLDGSTSYDPLGGALTYEWTQLSGPTVQIAGAKKATPWIKGFVPTAAVQKCVLQLVVSSDGRRSRPSRVSVFVVPAVTRYTLYQTNPPFDPSKPVLISFGGGDCVSGSGLVINEPARWIEVANLYTVRGYGPPYESIGDQLIVELSRRAPDYTQPIQTIGFSTGGNPAIRVAKHLNMTYRDPRYAVNRVTLCDSPCLDFPAEVAEYQSHPVAGEPAWAENLMSRSAGFVPGALNVIFPGAEHGFPLDWFKRSILDESFPNGDPYNGGVTAGAYLSVAGPGKNLDLAANGTSYYFKWSDGNPDDLALADPGQYPGLIPEPVVLVGPPNGATIGKSGAVLSCATSQNAARYQLLMGPDAQHLSAVVSDTAAPPTRKIKSFPYETTYWTVRALDQFGSAIHADPRYVIPAGR